MLPALTLGSCAAALAGALPLLVPGALIATSFLLTWLTERRSVEALALLEPLAEAAGAYQEIFQTLERASFESPHLQSLQRTLLAGGAPASAGIASLARLAAAVGWRRNFFSFLANGLFLFDFAAGLRFARWRRRAGAQLAHSLAVWSECAVLLSLSTLTAAREQVAFPTLAASGAPRFMATALKNPLLPETAAVPNDAALTAGTTILTGSNMSGKTTWLRTIGMNALLAWTGARAALRHLTNDRSITLVSTHDFELCDLTVPGAAIENAHFEEHYEDGKIRFDYRLRAGRCRTTNAVYLLRLVGILTEDGAHT